MKSSILDGKRILAVDDEPDVLSVLEEEIHDACPNARIEKNSSMRLPPRSLRNIRTTL